jgi:hypothetical protein
LIHIDEIHWQELTDLSGSRLGCYYIAVKHPENPENQERNSNVILAAAGVVD